VGLGGVKCGTWVEFKHVNKQVWLRKPLLSSCLNLKVLRCLSWFILGVSSFSTWDSRVAFQACSCPSPLVPGPQHSYTQVSWSAWPPGHCRITPQTPWHRWLLDKMQQACNGNHGTYSQDFLHFFVLWVCCGYCTTI